MKFGFLLTFTIFFFSVLPAQTRLDAIEAVVGDEIILTSDIENQYNYLLNNGSKENGTLRCQALESIIVDKVLLSKAKQDSITVTDDEITSEVERRVSAMMQNVETKEDFEKIVGRSLEKFKMDIRDAIEEELLIDQQRNKVLANAEVTPKEVKDYYNSIPKDSLGLLPAEVEINHIVSIPPFSDESRKKAIQKLEELRKLIVEQNADFGALAKKYSQEPGASKTGGDLGEFGRGMMVPEFEATVYSMRKDEISKVVETEFGFHLIKLLERRGEIAHAQHILIIPQRDVKGDSIAIARLNKALKLIRADSLTFEEAAIRFSMERESKDCGGCVQNPQTGELRIPLQQLDTEFFFKVDEMKKGDISNPMEYTLRDGTKAFHVIYLKNKIPPHKPNLKDDYKKINNAAIQAKQVKVFEKWLVSAKKNLYIDIKSDNCKSVEKKWEQ
ncbi:MAG: peptidylprolyl isomerase [Bacteroidia bacterium]|nr:peptidylprolyl isomerase [Bacteroidia bacterium]